MTLTTKAASTTAPALSEQHRKARHESLDAPRAGPTPRSNARPTARACDAKGQPEQRVPVGFAYVPLIPLRHLGLALGSLALASPQIARRCVWNKVARRNTIEIVFCLRRNQILPSTLNAHFRAHDQWASGGRKRGSNRAREASNETVCAVSRKTRIRHPFP
jgi:hypothetical protein